MVGLEELRVSTAGICSLYLVRAGSWHKQHTSGLRLRSGEGAEPFLLARAVRVDLLEATVGYPVCHNLPYPS